MLTDFSHNETRYDSIHCLAHLYRGFRPYSEHSIGRCRGMNHLAARVLECLVLLGHNRSMDLLDCGPGHCSPRECCRYLVDTNRCTTARHFPPYHKARTRSADIDLPERFP